MKVIFLFHTMWFSSLDWAVSFELTIETKLKIGTMEFSILKNELGNI